MASKLLPINGTVRFACESIVYYVFKHCRHVGGYKWARVAADGLAVGLTVV